MLITSDRNEGRPAAIDTPAPQTNRTLPRCCSAMRTFGMSGPPGTSHICQVSILPSNLGVGGFGLVPALRDGAQGIA
jgi:hypothetical protein